MNTVKEEREDIFKHLQAGTDQGIGYALDWNATEEKWTYITNILLVCNGPTADRLVTRFERLATKLLDDICGE